MIKIDKYIGTYRVFREIDLTTGKPSKNENDTYLLGKSKSQCYRYSDSLLALYLPSGTPTANKVLPLLKELNVNLILNLEGDHELVYIFKEEDIHKVNQIMKFQTKGAKIKPNSIRTARRINK